MKVRPEPRQSKKAARKRLQKKKTSKTKGPEVQVTAAQRIVGELVKRVKANLEHSIERVIDDAGKQFQFNINVTMTRK